MKVLHYVDSLNRVMGGPARSASRLAEEQSALGLEASVLANNYQGLGDCLQPNCSSLRLISARRLPMRMGAWNPGFRGVMREMVAKSDVVHIHGLWLSGNHQTAREAIRLRKPFIVSPRGMLESWARDYRGLRKQIVWHLTEKKLLLKAGFLHATAGMEAESLREAGLSNRIVVIPNGVDIPGRGNGEEISRRFPQLKNRRVLLFLSRLHPKKGLDDLLVAWASINKGFPDWILAIAGSDYDGRAEVYRAQAVERGVSDSAIFLGEIDGNDKTHLLAISELFVLPSYSENFGLAIAEALSAGKPVITTTATPWQAIEEKRCGWRISPGEASLIETLKNALSLPSTTLAEMGERAHVFARSQFQWSRIAKELADVYTEMLKEPGHGPY